MKKKYLFKLLIILTFLSFSTAFAQEKGFGLGVMVGQPTGISAKYWLSNINALDFSLAYSIGGTVTGLSIHADYVYHLYNVIDSEYMIPVYYGFGIRYRTGVGAKSSIGVRGVVGLLLFLKKLPIDIFIEAAPVFELLPATKIGFDAAVGARYYFKLN